jgi:XTP/dITP diphosphohydrolase
MSDDQVLLFATRNQGKVAELIELTRDLHGLELRSLDGYDLPEVEEDGDTFAANAAKKAREVSAATGLPALADDSGLEVDALDLAPGVHSARYAGEGCDDEANNQKLVGALAGISQRSARFRSALALADVHGPLGDQILLAEGVCEGEILEEGRGEGGFGYDPLFYVPELDSTFAELGIGTKNERSHRARAMAEMIPKLIQYFGLKKRS